MTNPILVKYFALFLGGAIFTFVAIQAATNLDVISMLGFEEGKQKAQHQLEVKVRETSDQATQTVAQSVTARVLGAIVENPALAPFFQTKKEVETTINSVMSLPEEQRSAICKQICTD